MLRSTTMTMPQRLTQSLQSPNAETTEDGVDEESAAAAAKKPAWFTESEDNHLRISARTRSKSTNDSTARTSAIALIVKLAVLRKAFYSGGGQYPTQLFVTPLPKMSFFLPTPARSEGELSSPEINFMKKDGLLSYSVTVANYGARGVA